MTVEDFRAFYSAIHKYPPFDWQEQLMKMVAETGWPATIALPTSSGKTSAIDIAVFHLALQACRTMRDRDAALRTFFVIDRRVVVDEAAEHAAKIATALKNASDGIVAEAAKRLLMYGGELPLEVSTMRGGMYRDNSWADEPNQPLICVSTVDQTGSRLLFRGYQVGESSRPVHAGLIGNDSLIILDEAHLSTAFCDTLAAVRGRYMTWADSPPAKPLRLVQMSATMAGDDAFEPGPASFAKDAELARRLNASKPAELLEPKKKFEDEMIAAAKELAGGEGVRVVGVIANTVGAARAIFEKLTGAEKVLLIGRNRPYCAQKLWDQYKERIAAKMGRVAGELLYVVATQTVEVGANIDFDALVTEAAPLDSLRQRFGRLNRLGTKDVAKAVVVRRKEDVVYGPATARTWDFLKQLEPVDFGVVAMDAAVKGYPDLVSLNAALEAGPLLFPAHLEFWVQTNPTPSPDPDVAPFLHGRQALEAADVQVVWRADLKTGDEDNWGKTVELAPPVVMEALALPVAAVRRWLRDQHQEIADIEGLAIQESKEEKRDLGRSVLRWRGLGNSKTASAREIRPGDTVVVPCSYGGADEYGWRPGFADTRDIGDEANNEQAKFGVKRPRLRVDLLPNATELKSLILRLRGTDEEDPDAEARDAITELLPKQFKGKWRIDSSGKVIAWPYQKREKPEVLTPSEETDEDDGSSFIGESVPLEEHTKRVAERARRYSEGCGLTAELVDDIVLAAENHDLGKRDERFQSLLYGRRFNGGDKMLAKSDVRRTYAEVVRIRKLAGYPAGARHEAGSVSAAGASGLLDGAHDRGLVLYLIGVHHGYGRPLFPVWEETSPDIPSGWELARIDSGWLERFWTLNRKYGYWGLAYLESILRRPTAWSRVGRNGVGRIELTGLKSGTPIGFMAALGAFRHAERIGELGGAKLAWTPHGGQWCASLHTGEAIEFEAFVKLLLERVKSLGRRREFEWSEAVKSVVPEAFAGAAVMAIREALADDHEFADWFAAFGSELALKNEKVESSPIESTPLDMTVARQLFLADAAALTASLATPDKKAGDAPNLASFREALLGPWKYKDNQHSLGWDPSTVLMGAFTPKAPTAMSKEGVRGAVWLAMESLPFFPCVYDGGLATRGFVRERKKQRFIWPIWTEPLSDMAILTLLSHITGENEVNEWKSRGVAAIYSSEVYKPNKYLTSFQAAELLG